MPTKIEWATEVWNPVTGYTKVSAGCAHCYAERMAKRLRGRWGYPADEPFRVTLHEDRLDQPLHWRKPRRVFVCSMADLFHGHVRVSFINDVFSRMWLAQQHEFIVLTKQPGRMRAHLRDDNTRAMVQAIACRTNRAAWKERAPIVWPLPNVWLLTSIEDQQTANNRVPLLLDTPAAVRGLSCEPLLGPIKLRKSWLKRLDWVIIGGESGPGARPCYVENVRELIAQCKDSRPAVFVKQLGHRPWMSMCTVAMLKHPKGGDPAEWPADLRVREWPAVVSNAP